MTTAPEVISACENVCRDFGVVWRLLVDASPKLVDATPLLALLFAILTYFRQRHLDREAELRHVRRKLYADVLRKLNVAYHEIKNVEGWETDPRFLEVNTLKLEVSLLSENEALDRHIAEAICAIKGKNDPQRRGMHSPHGKDGLVLGSQARNYTGKPWVFHKDWFDKAISELQKSMVEDLKPRYRKVSPGR